MIGSQIREWTNYQPYEGQAFGYLYDSGEETCNGSSNQVLKSSRRKRNVSSVSTLESMDIWNSSVASLVK